MEKSVKNLSDLSFEELVKIASFLPIPKTSTNWRRVYKNWCIIQCGAIIREYETEYEARQAAAKIKNCKVEYIER